MKVRAAQKLRDTLAVAGIIIALCYQIYEPLLIIGGVVAFSCFIPHFLYNKCPHCGELLGRNVAKHCQHCGEALD